MSKVGRPFPAGEQPRAAATASGIHLCRPSRRPVRRSSLPRPLGIVQSAITSRTPLPAVGASGVELSSAPMARPTLNQGRGPRLRLVPVPVPGRRHGVSDCRPVAAKMLRPTSATGCRVVINVAQIPRAIRVDRLMAAPTVEHLSAVHPQHELLADLLVELPVTVPLRPQLRHTNPAQNRSNQGNRSESRRIGGYFL